MNSLTYNSMILDWLLEGDPAIRYHTLRDLVGADTDRIRSEQARVETEGWGARLLSLQDMEGTWAHGLYTPKWTSTFYTLLLLKSLGMRCNDKVSSACRLILEKGNYADGGINLWPSMNHSEVCVSGMFLSILCHFGIKDPRVNGLVEYLLSEQMHDGGWNCRIYKGARHSSFHTSVCVLEGLWEFEKRFQGAHKSFIKAARNRGFEFLLEHRLFRSHRTGQVVDPNMIRFHFPYHWKYDIMRALDYAREAQCEKDPRMREAIDIIRAKRLPDGRWKLPARYPGKFFFEMEKAGEPSRWNTLRGFRILDWYFKEQKS